MKDLKADFQAKLSRFRREFHRCPEIGWEEKQTAKRIGQALEELGICYRASVADTGVLAEIPGKASGPYIALRADMDALPIVEETGLEFASENHGVMHACAHDGHMAMLLGAAELLLNGDPPELPIRLIFQPAEELVNGAVRMIEEGALQDVAMIFGGHIDCHHSTGMIVVHEGALNASTDEFRIEVQGQAAHGARPHESVDAVYIGSMIVIGLQALVSRKNNPVKPAVLSVCCFDAGTTYNVIAGSALLRGNIRAQSNEVRDELISGLSHTASSIAATYGATVKVEIVRGSPPVTNTAEGYALAREAAVEIVGEQGVVPLRVASMGGEDFGQYLMKVPGCFVRYGAAPAKGQAYPAHSGKFDFDEKALPLGAAFLAEAARRAAKALSGEK